MPSDYIPSKDADFLDWAKNLAEYTAAHLAAFAIEQAAFAPVQTVLAEYQAAYQKAQEPSRSKLDVLAKNEAKDALETAIRRFVNEHLRYNSVVSDVDREGLGIPLHNNKPTPIPAPSTQPEFEVDTSVSRQLTIHFHNRGAANRGKPHGVHGVEIRRDFCESPPDDVETLSHSEFDTRSPHTLVFKEGQRGQKVSMVP